jgi:hypothetical protein
MTLRPTLALLTLLLLSGSAQASPKRVLRAIASHVTLDFAAGASSGLASRASYDCRARNGPAPCTMHYGSLREFAISDAALTGTAIFLSEYGRKAGFKEWFVPALAVTAGNAAFAVKQWRGPHAKKD